MNLAVGFLCHWCGHETANLLELVKDKSHNVIGHLLQCVSCESVYAEMTDCQEESLGLESLLEEAVGI
jgi:uncharacterized Zn finger protein